MLKRHEIEVLLKAGHAKIEVAGLAGVSLSSIKRIAEEVPVVHVDDAAERGKRRIGRPSQVENFRKLVVEILEDRADLPSVEVLRRVRQAGYAGGKSALYGLVASWRPKEVKPLVRFEGLPGEFSQHDFGQVDVEFRDGSVRRIHFFASRLKYSRWVRVSLVKDETVESLVRSLAQHLASWGGAPLVCVFDRPKTVALKWRRNGEVSEWNPVFACATLEMGIGVELCWPYRAQEKGAVENLVGFVKGSFFKVRRFQDPEDSGAATGRVASGSERGATLPGDGSDPRRTPRRGGAAPACLEGGAEGVGLAHPGLCRPHRDRDARRPCLLDAAGGDQHAGDAVFVRGPGAHRGRPARSGASPKVRSPRGLDAGGAPRGASGRRVR